MKKWIAIILSLCLLANAVPAAMATEETTAETEPVVREPDQCGDDLYWSYEYGTLTISGTGAMDDFPEEAPWAAYSEIIETVLLSGSVTTVGANAFTDYDALKRVEFGGSLQEIGTKAFKSCDGLTSVTLPKGFRRFGEESFMSCANLTEIHCNGGMPSFNLNCLWDTYAKIYYPVNNPWPLTHIEQLESAFQGRIEFLAEDGTDPYVPPVVTEPEETEPEITAAATEEPSQPATEPATEPAEEVTVPSTETTIPETEPAKETEPPVIWTTVPTEPEQKTPDRSGGIWMGLCLISGTLSLVLLGALIFRRRRG